jgi:hypothetical protein
MFSFLVYFFVAYLLYKLVFSFILPVLRATFQIRKGFRSMKQQMNQQANPGQSAAGPRPQAAQPKSDHSDEYIEFEEM